MESGPQESPEKFRREPIHPDLLEFARQTFDGEEFLAQLREMETEGGGLTLEDFIAEIKALATSK